MKYSVYTTAAFLAAVFLIKSPETLAQVEVVESSPTIRAAGQAKNPFSTKTDQAPESNIQSEMYYQLQTLQQEVAALRGQLEEQAYELKRLKQQRLDDYTDLDGRLSGSPRAASGATRSSTISSQSGSADQTADKPNKKATSSDEFASYNGAMDLIRAKQYDQAIESFKSILSDYPQGQYAANSYHWLGQLYQLRNAPEKARDAYSKVVTDYPENVKASDAKLKLGQLYFQLGEKEKSKALLQEVVASGVDESRLAKNFLSENFPQK